MVPSYNIADEYKNAGAIVITNLKDVQAIEQFQNQGENKAIVFANRYDGVDLPDDKCRILILDSLPPYGNLSDIFEQRSRSSSVIVKAKTAQKIEQGLGRSVRGEKDYSVILLIGKSLVEFVNTKSNEQFFSEQTNKQIQLGNSITSLIKEDEDEPLKALLKTMKQCLTRDEEWKEYYADEMGNIQIKSNEKPYIDLLIKEKNAERAIANKDYKKAKQLYRALSDSIPEVNGEDKGWYLEKVAKCDYLLQNKEAMEKEQMAAHRYNNKLFLVVNAGRISLTDEEIRFYENAEKLISGFKDEIEFNARIKEELENLSFGKPAKQFEGALDFIGRLLAYSCERPDNTEHSGPDNLWLAPDRSYVAIECKNEVNIDRETISKDEAGQFNNHIGWMKERHPNKKVDYIFVHPSNKLDNQANLVEDVRCITPENLEKFKKQVLDYTSKLIEYGIKNLSPTFIIEQLQNNKLTKQHIIKLYTDIIK